MGDESMRAISLRDKGGHFYRADFQVHTPRDTQWDGARPPLAGREQWAAVFVAAARERGLDAVAISDHHDFTYFPYIRKAAAVEVREDGTPVADAERLVVFPALELTLSVPCQAIMILDADFPEGRLNDVLKALHFDPVDPSLDALPQTTVLQDWGTSTIYMPNSTSTTGCVDGTSFCLTSRHPATRRCCAPRSRRSTET